MANVVRCQPNTLDALKLVVDDFAHNFDPEKAQSMARHTRVRAQYCVDQAGGHLEHLISKRRAREE